MIVDESHVTIPQIRGMYGGDASRKHNLVRDPVTGCLRRSE